jgi:hypothetical protein
MALCCRFVTSDVRGRQSVAGGEDQEEEGGMVPSAEVPNLPAATFQ